MQSKPPTLLDRYLRLERAVGGITPEAVPAMHELLLDLMDKLWLRLSDADRDYLNSRPDDPQP